MKLLSIITFLIIIITRGAHAQASSANPMHNVDSAVLSWHLTDYHDADELTDTLTSAFDSDSEKIRAIYFWVTQYISYDLKKYQGDMGIKMERDHDYDKDGYLDKNKMIKHTLVCKKGVCEDYADLFAYMCNYAKIKCEVISGLASSGSPNWISVITGGGSAHAWNAVMLNNKWHLIDATWASGYFEGERFKRKRNDHYYFTLPAEMIKDHFPDEPEWQLLDNPIDKKTFLHQR